MSNFRIPKSCVIAAIAGALSAREASRPKIAARLALLNRMGFPEGANAGRGYRGGYTAEQLWQAVLGFKLLQFGVSLSTTIDSVRRSWDIAYLAISHAFDDRGLSTTNFYWLVEPVGLDDFELPRRSRSEGKSQAPSRPIETVDVSEVSIQEAASQLGFKDFMAIHVASLAREVLETFDDPSWGIGRDEFLAEMQAWWRTPVRNVRAHLDKKEI